MFRVIDLFSGKQINYACVKLEYRGIEISMTLQCPAELALFRGNLNLTWVIKSEPYTYEASAEGVRAAMSDIDKYLNK